MKIFKNKKNFSQPNSIYIYTPKKLESDCFSTETFPLLLDKDAPEARRTKWRELEGRIIAMVSRNAVGWGERIRLRRYRRLPWVPRAERRRRHRRTRPRRRKELAAAAAFLDLQEGVVLLQRRRRWVAAWPLELAAGGHVVGRLHQDPLPPRL